MLLRAWRFMASLLTALVLTMESAHVLELPQKMPYDAVMYAAVNGTLYRSVALFRPHGRCLPDDLGALPAGISLGVLRFSSEYQWLK